MPAMAGTHLGRTRMSSAQTVRAAALPKGLQRPVNGVGGADAFQPRLRCPFSIALEGGLIFGISCPHVHSVTVKGKCASTQSQALTYCYPLEMTPVSRRLLSL